MSDVRILALETTGVGGGAAAVCGGHLLASVSLAAGERSARHLAPAIAKVLREAGWRAADVELVAVTIGPGSFTGLRVGVTTAKTLAYAVGAEVLGVDALEVVAAQTPAGIREVWAVFDAQRSELFVTRLTRTDSADPFSISVVEAARIVDAKAWIAHRRPGEIVTGPGLGPWQAQLPRGVTAVEPSLWQPQAATVGQIAWRKYEAGERGDVWALSPQYMRVSAAEEKRGPAKD